MDVLTGRLRTSSPTSTNQRPDPLRSTYGSLLCTQCIPGSGHCRREGAGQGREEEARTAQVSLSGHFLRQCSHSVSGGRRQEALQL